MSGEAREVRDAAAGYALKAEQEVPAAYKRTEVGVIPEDWAISGLEALGKRGKPAIKAGPFGSSLKKDSYVKEGYKVYGQEQVIRGDYLYGNYFIDERKFRDLESCAAGEGDILLSLVGTTGKLLVLPKGAPPGIINPRLIRLSFDEQKILPDFFKYLFQSVNVQNELSRLAQGGTMDVLNARILRMVRVQLPSVQEQHAIATALSDVDALIAALDKLIAKKRAIKTAAMRQLLTGKTRLPGFSGEWSKISMDKDAVLKARIGWQALTTEEYLTVGKYYLVTGTDFIAGRVNWASCYFVDEWRYNQDRNIQLRDGDVLLTKDGTIGKVGYVDNLPGAATLNSGVFVIRPQNAAFSPLFLFYVLSSRIFDDFLAKITAGSTITHLYQKDFVTFEFMAPSLEEQTAIAQVLSDMDAEIAALEARRDKTRAIKQGMMQQLLTGRVRLDQSMDNGELIMDDG